MGKEKKTLTESLVLEFGKIVKKSVEKQKMLAWQYNAIGVSDAITMGSEGKAYIPPTPLVSTQSYEHKTNMNPAIRKQP